MYINMTKHREEEGAMLVNLKKVMRQYKITGLEMSRAIGIGDQTYSNKIYSKHTQFRLDEMRKIQKELEKRTGEKFTLDYLFKDF